jgi:hypothetical protein
MQTTAPQHERRQEQRMRCLKSGRVVLANHNSTLNCRVRSQSPRGARLECEQSNLIPREFTLLRGAADGSTRADHCEVMWRSGAATGIRFIKPSTANTLRNHILLNDTRYPV